MQDLSLCQNPGPMFAPFPINLVHCSLRAKLRETLAYYSPGDTIAQNFRERNARSENGSGKIGKEYFRQLRSFHRRNRISKVRRIQAIPYPNSILSGVKPEGRLRGWKEIRVQQFLFANRLLERESDNYTVIRVDLRNKKQEF